MRTKGIIRTGLANSLFQITFLAIMYAIGHTTSLNTNQAARFLILAALVFVPCIIWTLFFYLQDRYEPEPISHIISPFIGGMAAAALGAVPLNRFLFRSQEWIYASLQLFTIGSFFVKASVASLLFYIVLRYGFMPLKEFNEPVDGMFYGAVVGTGFAFVYSMHYLLAQPTFTLYVIAFTATVNVLIFSSVGALMGYILSLPKFRKKNITAYSILAITLGVILLGIFYLIGELFFVSGIEHAFWFCFVSVLIYSLVILSFCYVRMYRLSTKGIFKGKTPQFSFDLATALFIGVLLLTAGVISNQALLGKKFTSKDHGLSFRYPHSLSTHTLSSFSEPVMTTKKVHKILFSGKSSSPPFIFTVKADGKVPPLNGIDPLRFVEPVRKESFLVESIDRGGKKGRRIAYSYLDKKEIKESRFPSLVQVYTDVFEHKITYIIFSYKAESAHFAEGLPQYDNILHSLNWQE